MIENMELPLALLAGFLLGMFFFGGLWWTVQKGITSQNPAFWFFGSLMLRTGLTLAGVYFVSQGHWSRLSVCLFGFVIARFIVVKWLARATSQELTPLRKETRHAS
jgi:F1F0 ATPase subunit 2